MASRQYTKGVMGWPGVSMSGCDGLARCKYAMTGCDGLARCQYTMTGYGLARCL